MFFGVIFMIFLNFIIKNCLMDQVYLYGCIFSILKKKKNKIMIYIFFHVFSFFVFFLFCFALFCFLAFF